MTHGNLPTMMMEKGPSPVTADLQQGNTSLQTKGTQASSEVLRERLWEEAATFAWSGLSLC